MASNSLNTEIDRLIDQLADDDAEPFEQAKSALSEFARSDFARLAAGVARALARLPIGHASTVELPWIIAKHTVQSAVVQQLEPFLRSADTGLVMVAMDVLVELGDASQATLIAPLQSDSRWVVLRGQQKPYTVGAYAKGALDRLLLQNPNARRLL